MRVILPWRMALQDISCLPWLTGGLQLLSYKVPLRCPPCKDFSRAWLRCLPSTLSSVPPALAGAMAADCGCGQSWHNEFPAFQPHSTQRVENVFYLIISVLVKPLLGFEYNFSIFYNFRPQPSFHTHFCDTSCYLQCWTHSILSHPCSALHSTETLSYCLKCNQTKYKYVVADTFCTKFCEHKETISCYSRLMTE